MNTDVCSIVYVLSTLFFSNNIKDICIVYVLKIGKNKEVLIEINKVESLLLFVIYSTAIYILYIRFIIY